ncbi:MAG: SDR family NAD(P)-dependent oxidoreductase [Persicimonas sp.]
MDDVLVTGATGFIGERLAHDLLDEGYRVRVLARTPSKAAALAERGAEIVEGDVTDLESVRAAMDGVDGVFHLAAIYELGADPDQMRAVNVGGTENVLDAASEAGVSRVVYCGSDTSLGNTRGAVCDESKTHDGSFRSVYELTKHKAHQLVEERIEAGEPIVNAIVSTVYGPGDESPIAELIRYHLAGHAVAHLDRNAGYTFAHVDDVATGLRLAYERGDVGERYLLSGTPASFETLFGVLSRQTGIPAPRFELPSEIVDRLAPFVERGAALLGKRPAEVREMIAMGRGVTRYFSSKKARRELDWEPRPLEEGLRDTLPWFYEREREASDALLEATRAPLGALAVFDVGLGATAVFLPDLYNRLMHPRRGRGRRDAPDYLLARTGTQWLFFSAVQGVAALQPAERPGWVLGAGVLRLLDVPADLVYLLRSDDQGLLGKLGLASAPIFNLATGALLVYAGYRGLRARRGQK